MIVNNLIVGHGSYGNFIQALRIAGIPVQEVPKEELKKAGRICSFRQGEYNCKDYCYGMGSCENETCVCCNDTCDNFLLLKMAHFQTIQGEPMVVEEFVERVDEDDNNEECSEQDHKFFVDVAIYAEGKRPTIETIVAD